MSFMEDGLILAGMKPMAQLGDMHAASFKTDPKHLGFVLARYHFVARMLQGMEDVLELGSGDGTGARIVDPVVGTLWGVDREMPDRINGIGEFVRCDFVKDGIPNVGVEYWDAIYALDVLEHIAPIDEDRLLHNITEVLGPHGVCIIGMPSPRTRERCCTAWCARPGCADGP